MNKKKKSTNTFPYPDEVIDRLARAFYPAILACWNSEEGQREFAAWQAEQAHHTTSKRNRAFPTGNALLYISLSYVDFGRVRPSGCTLFFLLSLIF
ncbi:transposase [Faecalibacterium prausnitzii]|uniref:transposase n=1 Tax=Faecalibacterium prausnitzii TaxID=853 RepID=UPI001FA7A8B1|nr:transposase [Faecalibacterium prausnitzii]